MEKQVYGWRQVRHFQKTVRKRASAITGNYREITTLYAPNIKHNSRFLRPSFEFFDHIQSNTDRAIKGLCVSV